LGWWRCGSAQSCWAAQLNFCGPRKVQTEKVQMEEERWFDCEFQERIWKLDSYAQ
jgi:hypothetical protein